MITRFGLVIALLLAVVPSGHAAPQDEFTIKTPVMSRTISYGGGVLKTTKLEVRGEQVLAQPSVEFLLELDVNGEPVTLVPIDFEVKAVTAKEGNRTSRTEIELASKRDEFPLSVFVYYYTNPNWPYMQKSVLVKPIKKVRGATIRRIVIDDFALKPELAASGGGFAAVNSKSGKGIYFLTASLYGTESLTGRGGLSLAEEADQPVDAAYETGRVTIGAGAGGPDAIDRAFRDFIWGNYCVVRGGKARLDEHCVEVSLDSVDAKQRVKSLTGFASKCRDLRKAHPGQAVCLVPARPVQPADVHLLAVVDGIRVDLANAAPQTRDALLKIFPPDTLQFVPKPQ